MHKFYVAVENIWKLLGTDGAKSTLNKQRLNVGSGSTDSGGFLLPRAFVILRREPSPRAKVLRGRKHGHIYSNFRNDSDSGKGLNTWHCHNKFELGKVFFSRSQNCCNGTNPAAGE